MQRMAAKPFYADYTNRLLRWYCRAVEDGREVKIEGALDRENWEAVERAMGKLNEEEKCAIMGVYCKRDTMADNIYLTSIELDWKQDRLWALVGRVSRDVAKERRLV